MSGLNAEDSQIALPEPADVGLLQKAVNKIKYFQLKEKPEFWPYLPYPHVRLTYWRPEKSGSVNFGDELSRTIVMLMLARAGATIMDSITHNRQMVCIGSILHMSNNNAVVWGTGLHGAVQEREHHYTSLDVRAVRGPLTRRFLQKRGIDAPDVYGDPGLLVPYLTGGRFKPTSEYDVGLVPNLHDMDYVMSTGMLERYSNIHIINPMRSWDLVVADILKCKYIVASSLHGLVIADAYGIPARYIRLTEHEPLLKYHDYYEGTGRQTRFVNTLDEAMDQGGDTFSGYDPSRLLDAFPYDIWGCSSPII